MASQQWQPAWTSGEQTKESTTMTSPFNSLRRPARSRKGTSAPMKRVLLPALGLAAAAMRQAPLTQRPYSGR
jgi:hypothetical protein